MVFGFTPRSARALPNAAGCAPAGTDEDRFRIDILGALDESGKVRIGDRHADGADHLAAGLLERGRERAFAVMAGTVVGCERVGLFRIALLHRPAPERRADLRQRERRAHGIVRFRRDDRGRRIHDDHELLGLLRNVGSGERVRRQNEARQDVDAVAHDQFLGEALGDVRGDAAGILADDFDLLAGDGVPFCFM